MDYKTYVHRTRDTDEIFYVGHGHHARPWAMKRGRSQAWHEIASTRGCRVEILARYPDKNSAAQHEIVYIAACREQGVAIVNKRSGGWDRGEGVPKTPASCERIRQARLATNGNRKSIQTPMGQFPSMAQAARALGLSQDQIRYKIQKAKPGYTLC